MTSLKSLEAMRQLWSIDDRFTAIEDRYANYTVCDRDGDKIGKVDDIFVMRATSRSISV